MRFPSPDAGRTEIHRRFENLENELVALRKHVRKAESASRELLKRERTRQRATREVGRLDYEPADIFLWLSSASSVSRLRACAKEPWTVEWIESSLKENEVFYDIGANVGAYSLVAAKASQGTAQIIAFEPAFATFAILCENVLLNDLAEVVTPIPVPLSDRTQLDTFNYRGTSAGQALHSLDDTKALGQTEVSYRQPVLTFRLDDLIDQFGLPSPTHIKLDVDGAEERVLHGAQRALCSPSLRSVMVELNADPSRAVTKRLLEGGLSLQREFTPPQKPGRRPPQHTYGLFSRV